MALDVDGARGPYTRFQAISGTSRADIWVAGRRIYHWSSVPTGTSQDLSNVWGSGPRDAWAVGYGKLALHWDGQSWSQPAIYRPPVVLGRFAHAAAFAAFPQASPALLVGFGEAQSGVLRADSFLLDLHPGATTGQFAPQLGAAPPARREAALAYDDERGEVLLFGGLGAAGALGDTWRFEPAGHWSQR